MFGPLSNPFYWLIHITFSRMFWQIAVVVNWQTMKNALLSFSLLLNLSKLVTEAFKLWSWFQKLLNTTIQCSWNRILIIYCIHVITQKFHIFDTTVVFCSLRKWRMFHMTRLEPRKEKFTWKGRTTLNFRPGRWKDLRENLTHLKHMEQKIKWRKRTR